MAKTVMIGCKVSPDLDVVFKKFCYDNYTTKSEMMRTLIKEKLEERNYLESMGVK